MVASMRPRHMLRLVVAASVVVVCWSSCQSPLTAEEGFSCTNADAGVFSSLPPTNWWQLTNPPARAVPGIDYIINYYQCCRHCVWALGYPASAPIVAMLENDLNCVTFRTDFTFFDQDGTNSLNTTEIGLYLETGPNKFLVDNKMMDPALVYSSADLDRSGLISLEEFLVLRHYWAVVHLVRAGNLRPSNDGTPLDKGPLGGFFLDYGQVKAFFTVVTAFLLNKYWDNGFDASLVREPTEHEVATVVQEIDLDGSTRISLEEHYFRVFADRNGDGHVSNQEYYVSLYKKKNAAGVPDNPFLFPINFKFHDWNEDGRVTFLERKFVAADLNQDARIDEREWLLADFPDDYGPFEKHAVVEVAGGVPNLDSVRYFFYTMFHECASRGSIEYQTAIVDYPWSRSCIIEVLIERGAPFIDFEEEISSPCGGPYDCNGTAVREKLTHNCASDADCLPGRACSDFGFCHEMEQMRPKGPIPRKKRWKREPSGYDIKVFEEMASRLNYNYTLTPTRGVTMHDAIAPIPGETNINAMPPTILVLSSTHRQRHYAQDWSKIPISAYKCTKPLWIEDGLVVVINAKQEIVSSEEAMIRMLISASFINFVALFFIIVLGMAHIFWLLERATNPLFRPFYAEGVMDGVWFGFVTVTTVGYGDKVPITNIGKLLGAFWMLFGLICFGLFGGQVTNHISDMQHASRILGIESLKGLSGVGLLNTTDAAGISAAFGFGFTTCTSMKQCVDRVLTRENVAMLVPHSEVVQYFRASGMDNLTCGNPLLIVGDPVLVGDAKNGLQNSICTCDTCNIPVQGTAIYGASYFKDAFDRELVKLEAEGTLAAISEEFLTPNSVDTCEPDSEFNMTLIIAALITIGFSGVINFIVWSPWTKPWSDKKHANFKAWWDELMVTMGFKHRKFDMLSAEEVEAIEDDEEVNKTEAARHVQIARYLSKLQNLCVGHNTDVRNLQKEVMESRETMAKVIKFFMVGGALVLGIFAFVVTALIIVWGTEIKPSELGIPKDAEIIREL